MDKNTTDIVKAGCAGWLISAFCLGVFFQHLASEERDRVQAELERRGEAPNWLEKLWGPDPADDAYRKVESSGLKWFFIAGGASFYIAYIVKKGKLREEEKRAQAEVERLDAIARDAQERLDREARNEELSRSKKAIMSALGAVDQTLLAFSSESDPHRRIMIAQAAQEAVTSLESKLLSGQVVPEAMQDIRVSAHAAETLADAEEWKPATDRLARELRRLFALGEAETPVGNRTAESVEERNNLVDWMLDQSGPTIDKG